MTNGVYGIGVVLLFGEFDPNPDYSNYSIALGMFPGQITSAMAAMATTEKTPNLQGKGPVTAFA